MPRHQQLTPPTLWWTPWPGTGPGQEVLGDLDGRRVVELGCGRGDNAAACAAAGADVVGVDIAATKLQHARNRWRHQPQLRFIRAEASDYLATHPEPIDIACSIFGALSYAPAGRLLELIGQRLTPNGLLAISARLPPPNPTAGAGTWVTHAKSPTRWAALFDHHGFQVTWSRVLPHPTRTEGAGCLILTASPSTKQSSRRRT